MKVGQLVKFEFPHKTMTGVIIRLDPFEDGLHTEIFWAAPHPGADWTISVWANEDFVEHFRRNNDASEEDETDSFEQSPNSYHLCLDCQNSYDIDKPHVCDAQVDTEDQPKAKYFSSLIPEC